MKKLNLAAAALTLAACQPTTGDGPRVARGDQCGSGTYEGFLGQPSGTLRRVQVPEGTRFIFPGMPVTMDYNPERLNFDIDGNGIVTRVWCG